MKLFAISLLLKDEGGGIGRLCSAYDLSSFGHFQKTSVRQFMDFTSKLVVERSLLGQKLSITEGEYVCHVFVRGDRLACVLIADSEYPQTVGFSLMKKDPKSVDALTKLQSDVDETKAVLHNTLEVMLDRGEKLDDMVAQSEELTLQAKAFYLTAKKTKQCCVVL